MALQGRGIGEAFSNGPPDPGGAYLAVALRTLVVVDVTVEPPATAVSVVGVAGRAGGRRRAPREGRRVGPMSRTRDVVAVVAPVVVGAPVETQTPVVVPFYTTVETRPRPVSPGRRDVRVRSGCPRTPRRTRGAGLRRSQNRKVLDPDL